MPLHPNTEWLMAWAKRSALAQGRSRLSLDDLICAYALMAEDSAAGRNLFPAVTGHRPPRWPAQLTELCVKAKAQSETRDKFPMESTLKHVVDLAYLKDPQLGPEALLNVLRDTGTPLIKGFVAAVGLVPEASRGSNLADYFAKLSASAQRLVEGLDAKILGQGMAVRMLGDAFFKASLGIQRSGPRGVFTFLGPPGVGKTHMARTFAGLISEFEEGGHAFRRFDLGEFSGPQSHEQLFGTPPAYRNAGPGVLTGFVKDNPHCVLLFDELEKAHRNTILSMLSFLDSGEATDQNLNTAISFRNAWVIFTTNLGQDFFASSNQAGFLDGVTGAQSLAMEILASASRQGGADHGEDGPALAPEFVSRLAKGGAAVFRQLNPTDHLRLMENTLATEFQNSGSEDRPALPAVHLSHSARLLFLLSLLPDLDARRTGARTGDWITTLLRGAFEHMDGQTARIGGHLELHIDCDPATQTYLRQLDTDGGTLRILLADEDTYLETDIRTLDPDTEIHRVEDPAAALAELSEFRPDLALIDLSILEQPDSTRTHRALELLRALRVAAPDLPVFLFSENPGNRAGFQQVAAQVLRHGGARAFLPLQRDPGNPILMDHFLGQLGLVFEELRRDRTVRAERRRHRSTGWHTSYALSPEEGRIQVTLGSPSAAVLFGSMDGASPIRFSGVPHERLDDLVGLKRAKRRLQRVVDWLQNPAILARYAVPPPRGFLLEGPPGTGKTMLARAFAGTAGLPFLALSAGELQSKYVGDSEARIRDLFAKARDFAPAIIFIDEIDGIALRRSEHDNGHSRSLLNQLLACMDGFSSTGGPVFVLAATNHADQLDPALLRPGRFDEIIPVDRPNAEARKTFLERRLKGSACAGVNLEPIVRMTSGCTPAELDRVVREAVYLVAGEDGGGLTPAALEKATRLVLFGAEHEEMLVRPEEREVTAIHEAGHALAQLLLFPESSVGFLTIVPNERGALGFMAPQAEEDRHDLTEGALRRRLQVALAGREAERARAGEHSDQLTTGASGDLQMASRLAWYAITRYGLDSEFGPISLDGLPVAERAELLKRAAQRLPCWLAQATQDVTRLLADHGDLLRTIAATLIREESMDGEELRELARAAGGPVPQP